MSLKLRQACEQLMQDYDLDICYTGIDRETKQLTIYTPCGKTLVKIPGIVFDRLSPTHADVQYAMDLFATWLQGNKTKLQNYVLEFGKLQSIPQPRRKFEVNGVSIEIEEPYFKKSQYIINLNSPLQKVKLNEDLTYSYINFPDKSTITAEKSFTISFSKDVLDAAQEEISNRRAKHAAQLVVDTLLADLNKCET